VVAAAGLARTEDGVEIVKLSPDYDRRGLPRRRAILQALREADGSVYVQRSAGIETGVVGLFTRATGRRSIFSASSDGDFTRDRAMMSQTGGSLDQWRVRMQYRVGLRAVHAVVAQTEQQAQLARRSFRLDPHVIPSFCAPVGRADASGEAVLWIGSLTDVKDPLALLALAERTPDVPFWMIAHEHPTAWRKLAATVRARAARLPNLELLPRRPRRELFDLYDRAIAIVNTSRFEGFPNTFLEAWARAVPAVSLRLDPDEIITRHGMGVAAGGSLDLAAETIRRYFEDPETALNAGKAGLRYIEETHAPAVVTPKWLALVAALIGTPPSIR
jgi:glycosyltransferase involved in cell wall biosynthesis